MEFLPEGVHFNKNITYLAKTNFRNQEQVFGIKRKDRRQHMYVLGKSGTGKSALLGNMIVQNIWNGEGVAVVDPHGELVESILATIPPHRIKDVIYFNPADTESHIGFNVLQIDDPKYKHLVASGLMGIFTKIWANAWSARMEYILNNAILALLDTPGSTLLGIPRLLVDKDYRQTIINNLKDPVIKAFWVHEYETWRDQYRNEAIAPIQNKVGQFLSSSIIRNVVGQAKSTIDLFEAMNSGKIFLVNVSKGRIGEDNSALIGGMLITKLQLAAMERVRIAEEERKDFYLYVDEFQNFVTDSFASILSEARKYRLNLTLAHQYIAQLVTKESQAVRDAVFGNVGTIICFRVGATDADFLQKEFEPEFMLQDFVNLPNYTIYLKLMVDGVTSRPFSAKTLPPFKTPEDKTIPDQIIESSRKLYAKPRAEVEKEINTWSGVMAGDNDGSEGKFKAECSTCGKETMVPFEPEAGRPIYCKDCITKIKSGEIKPLKGTKGKDLRPEAFAPLAELGIEFTSSNIKPQDRSVRPKNMRPDVAKRPTYIKTNDSSDNELKPKNMLRPPRERSGPDHEGLQNILKEALGDALTETAIHKNQKSDQKSKEEKKPEEKKTLSLKDLKTSSPASTSRPLQTKEANQEHLSALQQAIAKAQGGVEKKDTPAEIPPTVQDTPTPVVDSVPPTPPEKIVNLETKVPEKNTPPDSTKKIREIPEDVLRRVLE